MITASGVAAVTEPTAELGGNGVIEIGPADVAAQRSMQETTAPVIPGGEQPILTTGNKPVTRAFGTRTTKTSPRIFHGGVFLFKINRPSSAHASLPSLHPSSNPTADKLIQQNCQR